MVGAIPACLFGPRGLMVRPGEVGWGEIGYGTVWFGEAWCGKEVVPVGGVPLTVTSQKHA